MNQIQIRVSKKEKKFLQDAAKLVGQTLSAFLRDAIAKAMLSQKPINK